MKLQPSSNGSDNGSAFKLARDPAHMYGEIEAYFHCPYCGERISMLLDLSAGQQRYVEDCEVCCRPIRVRYGVRMGNDGLPELSFVEAEPA